MRVKASITEIRERGLFFVKAPWTECVDFTVSEEHGAHYRIFNNALPYPVEYRPK